MKHLSCISLGLEPKYNLTFKYTVIDSAWESVTVHSEYVARPLKPIFDDGIFSAVGLTTRAVKLKI